MGVSTGLPVSMRTLFIKQEEARPDIGSVSKADPSACAMVTCMFQDRPGHERGTSLAIQSAHDHAWTIVDGATAHLGAVR